jgi:pyruvate,water dikinase
MAYINDSSSPNNNDISLVGGKAKNLWLLGRQVEEAPVPPWFVLTTDAFTAYNDSNGIAGLYPVINAGNLDETCSSIQSLIMDGSMPDDLCQELQGRLSTPPFNDSFLAVRSSGTDEDSSSHSFAGQFESFLFQKGLEQVMGSVKSCWASCYSQRVMSHRLELGLRTEGIKMAVIVQVMVDAHSSGVAFSRHPLRPLSTPVVFIEAVLGLGEGLVSGELVADQYEVSRDGNFDVTLTLADKVEMMVQDKDGGGVIKVGVNPERVKERALTDDEARKIARLMINLELKMEKPQDFEWAIENGQLYCLQARPIVTLPPSCFFDHSATGSDIILWDNSNIVESYSGVTTPLTFSFVSNAYEKVYTLTLLAAGVPSSVVKDHKPYLANMLGLVRGNIYYNLLSWYRCLTCIPLGDTSKYMETMMGVKQSLDPKIDAEIGYIQSSAPRYSIWVKIKLLLAIMERIYFIDSYVNQFFEMFDRHYKEAIEMDFESLTLQEQIKYIKHLNEVNTSLSLSLSPSSSIIRVFWAIGVSPYTMILTL